MESLAGPKRTKATTEVQPPRPPNAWILYRSDKIKTLPSQGPDAPRRAQGEVSKLISSMWKSESEAVRAEYERRAEMKKQQHQAQYPNYRFQPMKKEEKERLREEKRLEKERERAQPGGRRGKNRPAPYTVGMVVPSQMPPATTSYYQPHVHRASAGPSPPLSTASSPPGNSPSSEQTKVEDHSARTSPGTEPNTKNLVPPLTQSTAPPQLPYPLTSHELSNPAFSAIGQWGVPPPSGPQVQHPEDQQQTHPAPEPLWSEFNHAHPSAETVSFDIPQQNWATSTSFEDSLSALLFSTNDPSIYELSNIDPNTLLESPTDEIDVSLGPFAAPSFTNDNTNNFDFESFDFSSFNVQPSGGNELVAPSEGAFPDFTSLLTAAGGDPAATHISTSLQGPTHCDFSYNSENMLDYLNFEPTLDPVMEQNQQQHQQYTHRSFSNSSVASSRHVSGTYHSQPQYQPPAPAPVPIVPSQPHSQYVPPAGAAYASTRRVGGSWKHRFMGGVPDSPVVDCQPPPPPRPYGVPAG